MAKEHDLPATVVAGAVALAVVPGHPENQRPPLFSSPRVNSARARRPWFSNVRPKLPAAKLLNTGGAGGPSFGSPGWP